jgi:N-acetylmuramoyl-L-alanine amidase
MEIIEDFLTKNEWSRPGKALAGVKSIILHWTGNPMTGAKQNRDFFESRKGGKLGYGSAQYVVGLAGEVIRCVPDTEISYHCGSSQVDPASGKIYTDWARTVFGPYASEKSSPNNVSIGIELCVTDAKGNFDQRTLASAVELVAMLCKKHAVDLARVGTHKLVVGWKDCPKLWTDQPALFDAFKGLVKAKMA